MRRIDIVAVCSNTMCLSQLALRYRFWKEPYRATCISTVALTKAVVVVRIYHSTPTPYRFLAQEIWHTRPVRRPRACTHTLYSKINNWVVDTVVHKLRPYTFKVNQQLWSFCNRMLMCFSWGRSEPTDRNVELYPQFFLELITTQLRFHMVSPQLVLLIIPTMQSYKFCLCVCLFSHWNSNGKSHARIVDLWVVHFKWWPITCS